MNTRFASPTLFRAAAALPYGTAAAGAGVRPAGRAAGPQLAAADALRPGDARLPRLHGRHQPDVDGDRLAGQGQAAAGAGPVVAAVARSEEHTSELQSLMRISYAVFCLKKNTIPTTRPYITVIRNHELRS